MSPQDAQGASMKPTLLSAALFFAAAPAAGEAPFLSLPVDCELGQTCFLTALFDHDPSAASRDFACGTLTRDGHQGTDFALPNLETMRAGVDVLAAAAGTVRGTRDRHADILATDPAANFGDEFCGNGVLISHDDGWETQYCHMALGSIAVQEGQRVAQGTVLGRIGLSGSTTFPHLHLSVFKNRRDIDPFAPNLKQCGEAAGSLWEQPLPVPSAGFLSAGFSTEIPDFEAMKDSLEGVAQLSPTEPIVLWVSGYGSRPGDILDISIEHPLGTFHTREETMERRQEAWQRYTGRRYTDTLWPSGPYTATLRYLRDGAVLAERQITASISP